MNSTIKLIFNVYRCSCWKEKMYSRENFKKHLCTEDFHLAPVHDWIIWLDYSTAWTGKF